MSRRRLIASSITALCALLIVMRLGTWLFPFEARAQEPSVQPVQVESGEDGLLHWAPIEYPGRAIERRIEGSVVLELDIDEQGLVSGARVLSGPEELRHAALQSVLEWHYDPTKRAAGKAQVSIRYRLPNEEPGNLEEQELRGRKARLEALLRANANAAPGSEEKAHTEKQIAELKEQFGSGEQDARASRSRLEALLRARQSAAPGPEEKEHLEKQIAELKMALASRGVAGSVSGGTIGGVPGGVITGVVGGVPGGVEIIEPRRGDSENGTLQSIRTERLSPGARAELMNRLPVHVGDRINGETVKKIEEVLATIDEHLSLRLENDEAGNVSLMILPQNEEHSGRHEFRGARFWFPGPASGTVENREKPAAPR